MMKLTKLFSLAMVTFLLLVACDRRTMPPGPDAIGGTVGNTSYTLLDWDEGLRILIWSDIVGAGGSAGSGSTESQVYTQEGNYEAPDGRTFAYDLATTDGVTAEFAIDGEPYDLEEGALFLVTTGGEGTEVQQLDADLSAFAATNEAIEAFGRDYPEIAAMIEAAGGRR